MRKLIDSTAPAPALFRSVGHSVKHESAARHVAGAAIYIDDMPLTARHLHVAIGITSIAAGSIKLVDVSAVRTMPGVVDVIVQADIPGKIDIAPVFDGDPLLAGSTVLFHGQALFAVAATSLPQRSARWRR